jgi:hypothetical protein
MITMTRPRRPAIIPLTLATLTLSLAGCVSMYKPTSGGPTATLVIDSNQPGFVQAFKSEACDKAEAGSRISFLHPSAGDALRGTARPIEAGKPLILSMDMNSQLDGERVSCNLTGRFTPQPDDTYILFFRYNASARTCTLDMMRRSSLGSTEPEPGFTLLPVKCHNSVDG